VSAVSRSIERLDVTFDDETLVGYGGLIVPATVMVRLGLEPLVNASVRLGGRIGGSGAGRKVCSVVATILAGGTHIDHADMLRAGATQRVLPFRVMAPSTLGTFLGAFTFGHVRQLDKVIVETLRRAWAVGAGPGDGPMTIDLDSAICEVHGKARHGAAYSYTRVLGYHPILATRADTGEVLQARLRKGSAHTQRGTNRFVEELIARVRRAGATGALLRADAGFWSHQLIETLDGLGVDWSITVALRKPLRACIDAIPEPAWTPIVYPDGGQAAVAETTYVTSGHDKKRREFRLVVRRTRLVDPIQAQLWPDWRYHAFVTSLDLPVVEVDQSHRDHATVELAIRDLKDGAGLTHCPSGKFFANAAWLACAVLAHNLIRWTARLGDVHSDEQLTVARTLRTRLLALPGRVVNRSGRHTLRLPTRWPWADAFLRALERLRTIPLLT
jgi:Transposase DDE domain group 1